MVETFAVTNLIYFSRMENKRCYVFTKPPDCSYKLGFTVPYNVVRGETHVYDGKVESKWWAMPQGHRASRQAHGASPISVEQ